MPSNRGYYYIFEAIIIPSGVLQLFFLILSYTTKNRKLFKGTLLSILYTMAYMLIIFNCLIFGGLYLASLGADVNTH